MGNSADISYELLLSLNYQISLIVIKFLILEKMGNFGATEIILIILVIVLLFGGRKIPELMKGIGQGMKEFKKASKVDDEPTKIKSESKEETKQE
jgi:sec-independent protein translocase protein TatA